jgi:hypothetical protein
MKKIIFLSVLAIFTLSAAQSQTKIKATPAQPQLKVIKPLEPESKPPAPAPPPPPVNKSTKTTTQETLVYSLTSARVKIRTGNDNKEFPSKVLVSLKAKHIPTSQWSPFGQLKLDNEMRINSETEFGLERAPQQQGEVRLDTFQTSGIKLLIKYLPNFFADAWKIESVSLVLEFKDQYGNLHPTLGNKTITFSNAYGFLNNEYQTMECVTDGSFAPLTAVIKK